MLYWTRKRGSQRISQKRRVNFEPNFAGQGGIDCLIFFDGTNYLFFQPENIKEVRELQSQAGILSINVKETRS